jgi:hypothetical protein
VTRTFEVAFAAEVWTVTFTGRVIRNYKFLVSHEQVTHLDHAC